MNRTVQIKITELNPHLICVLCGGYYIDAATIIECLHSFCRTCITKYLDSSKYCPICDAMVHKTKPLLHVKSDKTLQDLVYKLVPGLYKSEMKRRRDFFAEHPCEDAESARPSEARGYEDHDRLLYTEDEKISLSLELFSDFLPDIAIKDNESNPDKLKKKDIRYLQCPAALTVSHLKKFLRMKFDLTHKLKIDMYHSDEPLKDYLTLMDIAYIYTWRRVAPLRLIYTVYENIGRKRKHAESGTAEQNTKQQKLAEKEEEVSNDRVTPVLSESNSDKQQDENSSPLFQNENDNGKIPHKDEEEKDKSETHEHVLKKTPKKTKLNEKGSTKNILNGKCSAKLNRNGNLFSSNLISRQVFDKELLNGKDAPLDMTKKTLKELKKMNGSNLVKSKEPTSNGVHGSLFPDFEFTD